MVTTMGYYGTRVAAGLAGKAIFMGIIILVGGGMLTYVTHVIASGSAAKRDYKHTRDILDNTNEKLGIERVVRKNTTKLLENANKELSQNNVNFANASQIKGPNCPISCLEGE